MQYIEQVQEKLLGILMSPDVNAANVINLIKPEYFSGENLNLFRACQALYHKNKPIELLTVYKQVKEMGLPGNPSKLSSLIPNGIFELGHIKHYIAELHEAYKKSRVESIKNSLMQDFDVHKAFDEYNKLQAEDTTTSTIDIHAAAKQYAFKMMEIKDGKHIEEVCSTNFKALDQIITGFKPSEFIILGGRPAHGKTTLAMQMALNMAHNNIGVGFITMEMSAEQLTGRLLSNVSQVDGRKFIDVKSLMSASEINKVATAADSLKNHPLYISDLPEANPSRLESEISKMIRMHNIKGVFIDYLQLVSPIHEDRSKAKIEQVTNISKQFKAICKRQNIWVCLISSLSRKVEERVDKRPYMADLRESGQLEYDADKVIFAYRPVAYMEENDPAYNDAKDVMEVLIRKNRNGELGVAVLSTDLRYTKIFDYVPKITIDNVVIRKDWNN